MCVHVILLIFWLLLGHLIGWLVNINRVSLRLACNSRYFVFSLVSLLSIYGSGVIDVKFGSESDQSGMHDSLLFLVFNFDWALSVWLVFWPVCGMPVDFVDTAQLIR